MAREGGEGNLGHPFKNITQLAAKVASFDWSRGVCHFKKC